MENDTIYVGLARICVPRDVRDHVKNDVVLRMAILEVVETLYIYVDSEDKHASVNYTSELYNTAWDIACTLDKRDIDIQIMTPAATFAAWNEFFLLPDLGAVYGEYQSTPESVKWLQRNGLLPVAYRSPAALFRWYMFPGEKYFEEDEVATSKFDVVLVNGTFDNLHHGHKKLLSLAVNICSKRIVIGITASPDLLAGKPFASLLEPLETRKRKVRDFVTSLNSCIDVEIQDAQEEGGPAATFNESGAAVAISTSDIDKFSQVNMERRLAGLPMLQVRIARRTDQSTLSSSRIRAKRAEASVAVAMP